MYKQAVKKAQSAESKKVGFNLQIPMDFKSEFERQCKQDNVTVTSMILSLMEVSLVESYLATVPKAEIALSDLKKILNSEDIFLPNPISKNNPMYSKTVSDIDFKKLMEIDLELALAIDEFKDIHHLYTGDQHSYKYEPLNLMESSRSYIRRISANMNKQDEFNVIQEKYMDITLERFNSKGKD